MIELHPFRNNDSPGIAAVWSDQTPLRGRVQKLTITLLEQHILSKPYFDPHGLIVAHEFDRVVGFVHVGSAPCGQPGELNRQTGIVSLVMVAPRVDAGEIAARLLRAGEMWLRDSGATELLGGGCGVNGPFYLGLYGGCRLPGVLAGDTIMIDALRAAGYVEHRQIIIWQRTLESFRPPVDRDLMALRRQYRLQPQADDPINNWSDACTYSWIDRTQFSIVATSTGVRCATLTFWNMEPLSSNWEQRAMGLADEAFDGAAPRARLLTCFLAEAMRQFQTQGVTLVEVQTESADAALSEACQKLAFRAIDRGVQFQKLADISVG